MNEEMITKDKLVIEDEIEESIERDIEELTEEIQEENKEIIDILKSDLYKTLFQVLKRVTLKIEITNIDEISSGNNSNEKSPSPRKDSKGKTESLKFQNITLVDQTEKAFKYRNEAFEICWFAKKGVNYNESTKELEVLGWWLDFVNNKGEPVEFKKDSK